MTNKELLSQIIDLYERKHGIILVFTEETNDVYCKLTVKFPSGRILAATRTRLRMMKDAPILYFDELRELAYEKMIELLEGGEPNKLKD